MLEDINQMKSGYGLLDIEKKGVSWILMDWKLKVIKRPSYGEELLVKTWGRNVKKVTTYRDYEIYNENNELCAIATTKWALLDINLKKIIRISPEIINKYILNEKSVFEEEELSKISIPEEFENCIIYTVQRRNIDVNGHMHNTHYLDLAYEALPEDIYNNRPYNNLRISYKKEIKLGDKVNCYYSHIDDKHVVVMKTNDITNAIVEIWN